MSILTIVFLLGGLNSVDLADKQMNKQTDNLIYLTLYVNGNLHFFSSLSTVHLLSCLMITCANVLENSKLREAVQKKELKMLQHLLKYGSGIV